MHITFFIRILEIFRNFMVLNVKRLIATELILSFFTNFCLSLTDSTNLSCFDTNSSVSTFKSYDNIEFQNELIHLETKIDVVRCNVFPEKVVHKTVNNIIVKKTVNNIIVKTKFWYDEYNDNFCKMIETKIIIIFYYFYKQPSNSNPGHGS